MKKQPRIKTPESGVLNACLGLLSAERIWHRRVNTGAVMSGNRFLRFNKKGDADIMLTIPVPYTRGNGVSWQCVCWVECKSDTGKQSPDQKLFEAEARAEGHDYLLVRSSDDLKKWLQERGVIK
jgi:hypothetical protein